MLEICNCHKLETPLDSPVPKIIQGRCQSKYFTMTNELSLENSSEDIEVNGSGESQLEEVDVDNNSILQYPPKWPIECQVIREKIEHHELPYAKVEPFYVPTNAEPQPQPISEENGNVIYHYSPKLPANHFSHSSFNGSGELEFWGTDPNTLQFESRFESGNLEKVVKLNSVTYELYLRKDMYTERHSQWFYFRIKNTRDSLPYRFSIVNLNKADSLYRCGMKPLVYSEKEAFYNKIGWVRSGRNVSYYKNESPQDDNNNTSYSLTFNLTFRYNDDTVYIAQCYPYTYSQLQTYLRGIQLSKRYSQICQQKLLCKSLAGNNVYVLTITNPQSDSNSKKPVVMLSARVHPGETPSSYMMKGIIDFLLTDSEEAKILRDRFIFKLIPMLNPDGVIVGNSRCCLLGQDLNREYRTSERESFPQMFYAKSLLEKLTGENGIFLYCDIHGHSKKNNAFIYGCQNKRVRRRILTQQIFPLMLHKNASDKFSFENCRFKIQRSREGTGRIFVWNLGVPNSYTLEISLCGSTLNYGQCNTHFNMSDYIQLGHNFCNTLAEYSDPDPVQQKVRERLLQFLREKGTMNSDEPINVLTSDYSGLHLQTEDDGSGGSTSDCDDLTPIKPKLKTKRKKGRKVGKSKNSKIKRTKKKFATNLEEFSLPLLTTKSIKKNKTKMKQKKSAKENVKVPDIRLKSYSSNFDVSGSDDYTENECDQPNRESNSKTFVKYKQGEVKSVKLTGMSNSKVLPINSKVLVKKKTKKTDEDSEKRKHRMLSLSIDDFSKLKNGNNNIKSSIKERKKVVSSLSLHKHPNLINSYSSTLVPEIPDINTEVVAVKQRKNIKKQKRQNELDLKKDILPSKSKSTVKKKSTTTTKKLSRN